MIVSCKEDALMTFQESHFSSDQNGLVDINIPVAQGEDSIATSINATIEKHIIYELLAGETEGINANTIQESIAGFSKEYSNFKNDFPDNTPLWEAQIDGDIMFQSEAIISIALTSYINTGGAQGILHISIYNFNAQTGKTILNKDLFNDYDGFFKIAKMYYQKEFESEGISMESEKFTLPMNIGYSTKGILLLYNMNEINTFSKGPLDFTIPYSAISYYLNYQ
tara:strand:- start:1428 stop:2099 length:672 start_codon:yes stop_codon:yes gene_type:complete